MPFQWKRTPQLQAAYPGGRSLVSQALRLKNIPENAIPTMIASIADKTLLQYNSTFKLWWKFCAENNLSVFKSGVREVISFLQGILDTKTHKFGTFNSHRAALSLLLHGNISQDLSLQRFLKGISNLRPALSKYNITWDTKLVTDYLEKLHPLEDLNLKDLSSKLATLLVLITGQRVQTIFHIRIDKITESANGLQAFIEDKLKTSGHNRVQPCLEIPFCKNNPPLCVASIVKYYIQKTRELRSTNELYLFLSTRSPHARASKDTISRWVKETLHNAGIDKQFTAHSTRHASTSHAFKKNVSLDVIRKTAGWSNNSTVFQNYYLRPIFNTSQFAKAILE